MSEFTNDVNKYLLAVKQGDLSQFDPLFRLTVLHLRSVARYYLKNKSYDEDVTIDAFVKVYKYIGSFDSNQNGYNWMCKIVENVALSYNFSQARAAEAERKFATEHYELGVENDFNAVDFFMIISEFDEPDHTIALMRFYLGFKLEEIGRKFKVSRVAIFNRVQKICKIFSKKYKEISKQK